MKKGYWLFILVFFIILIILSLISALVCYTGDPNYLFHKNHVRDLANRSLSGESINESIIPARSFQSTIIPMLHATPNIVVIGSSRSMAIGSWLSKDSVYNSSVDGAVLEDTLAIIDLYLKRESLPNTLIIEVSPWIFNPSLIDARWHDYAENYYNLQQQLSNSTNAITFSDKIQTFFSVYNPTFQLIDHSYFSASIKKIRNKNDNFLIQGDAKKLPDGSLDTSSEMDPCDLKQPPQFLSYLTNPANIYHLSGYTKIDEDKVNLFKKSINYLLEKKIRVVFYLPPYPHTIYSFLTEHNSSYHLLDVIAIINEIKNTHNNVLIVGNYDAALLNLNNCDFLDGMHAKKSAMKKIFKQTKL